jgi:hypothetical protein
VHDEGCWDEDQGEEDMMHGLSSQDLRGKNSRRYKLRGVSIDVTPVRLRAVRSSTVLFQDEYRSLLYGLNG